MCWECALQYMLQCVFFPPLTRVRGRIELVKGYDSDIFCCYLILWHFRLRRFSLRRGYRNRRSKLEDREGWREERREMREECRESKVERRHSLTVMSLQHTVTKQRVTNSDLTLLWRRVDSSRWTKDSMVNESWWLNCNSSVTTQYWSRWREQLHSTVLDEEVRDYTVLLLSVLLST